MNASMVSPSAAGVTVLGHICYNTSMKKSSLIAIISSACLVFLSLGIIFGFRDKIFKSNPETLEPDLTIPGNTKPYNFDYSWLEKGPYIAHALGGIQGSTYSNSYEAFQFNYDAGQRLFEADFSLTDDGDVVLLHTAYEWENHIRPSDKFAFTTQNFLSFLYDGKYHTMDYRMLIDLMIEHPDVYVITDSKYTDQPNVEQEFSQIITYAQNSSDPSVLNRLIIQIYSPEMLDWVMALYPWHSVIYTLYQDPNWTVENVRDFAIASGVKVITTHYSWVDAANAKVWHDADLTIATYTVDTLDKVQELRTNYDVKLFYTNTLLPYTYRYTESK